MDWVCVAFPTPTGSAREAVRGMGALGIAGLSVTMPHKAAVIEELDALTDTARLLNAVNCISRTRSGLQGHNTDGDGFLAAIRADFGLDPAGMVCAVLGAGGAARSVILALKQAGAAEILVVNRTQESAEQAAALAGSVGKVASEQSLELAELVVNATSVGMAGSSAAQGMAVDPNLLHSGQFLADLIYHPVETELMKAAQLRGCRVSNGLSMLIHQAAVAFEVWTAEPAPVQAMAQAIFDATSK
jgi:shikimate dehydrogenase